MLTTTELRSLNINDIGNSLSYSIRVDYPSLWERLTEPRNWPFMATRRNFYILRPSAGDWEVMGDRSIMKHTSEERRITIGVDALGRHRDSWRLECGDWWSL